MNSNDLLVMIPEWFQRVLEFPEIMKAYAFALNEVEGNTLQLWNNQYIQTCDETTLSEYEKFLGIVPSGTDTIEYRRMIVLNRYSMMVPFSEGYLRSRLDEMFGADGYELNVDWQTLEASIEITASVARARLIFLDLWYGVAPAHVAIEAVEHLESDVDGEQFFGGAFFSTVINNI
jgi:hypothetical protein